LERKKETNKPEKTLQITQAHNKQVDVIAIVILNDLKQSQPKM
jgi:hypothetical protein